MSKTAKEMIAFAVVAISTIIIARAVNGETVRWKETVVSDPPADIVEISWGTNSEKRIFAPCVSNGVDCIYSVTTFNDLPPNVNVRLRLHNIYGWSEFSNGQQYWECKDVAGGNGIVGVDDFGNLLASGKFSIASFGTLIKFFGQRC